MNVTEDLKYSVCKATCDTVVPGPYGSESFDTLKLNFVNDGQQVGTVTLLGFSAEAGREIVAAIVKQYPGIIAAAERENEQA